MEDKLCRMRVVVRVRPENKRECAGSFSSVVQVLDDQMLIFDPKEEDEFALFNGPALRAPTTRKRKDLRVPTTRKRKDLRFIFDTVFDGTASQADVYKASTQRLLQYLLQGINCTVFAYGATGAGKTHTMMGTKDEPGLMCLTLEELFQCVEQRQGDKSCTIAMSYLEVYNEQLSDLLVSNGPLTVYEDPQKGVGVKNLSMHKPKSVEELLQMLEKGNQNRTQHPTDTNASSSRSHALLQIYLKQEEHDPSLKHNVLISKLSLIDLAGSERALETKNSGQRMREGATINCSLLALGNCINALADSKSKKQHIPYRNSKLTRLLKDTLGGNCQTIMVAAISPSSASYEETYNTLNYASRAKDIKYMLKSNVLNSEKHISRYFKAYKDLKEEVAELKEKLSSYEVERKMEPIQPSVTNEPCSAQTLQLQNTMQNMFKQRCSLHRDRLHAQTQLKEMELRAYLRERDQERIRIFCSEESLDKATGKLERCIAASRTRCDYLEEQRRRAEDRLTKEDARLQRLQTDIAMSKVLWSNLTRGLVEEENLFLKGHLNHSMQLVALLEQDKEHTERLMRSLLHMARLQFNTLHSTGLAGSEESDAMTAVESLVKRMHGVAWADQDTVSPRTTSSESPLPRFSLVQFLTFPSSKLPHQQASSNLETRTETFTRLKRDLPVGMNTVPSVQKKYTTPFTKAPFVGHKRQISGLSPNYSPAVKRAKRQVLQDPQSPGHQRFPFCPRDNISHALDGVFPLPEEEIPCGIAPLNSTFTHDIEFASATFHEDEQLDDAQGMKENLKMPSQGDGSLKSWPQYHSFATSAQGKCKASMNRASVSRESRVQMLSNGPPVNRLEKFRHFSAVSKATAHRVRTSQNEPKSRPAIRRLRYVAAIPSLHNLSTPKRNIVEAQKCRKTC